VRLIIHVHSFFSFDNIKTLNGVAKHLLDLC
jgi:hypothetical protein